jgi:ABC-type phosphate transport system substrate-binding protein
MRYKPLSRPKGRALKPSVVALLLLAFALGVAGCGGGKSDSEKQAEAASKEAANEITCDGSPLSGDSGLPAGFPKPSGVTYVKTRQAGPTTVVNAYYGGELDAAFNAYKDAFPPAGYDIPFNEKEDKDAEVSYEKTGATTGLVALKAECDNGRISVRITSRSA